MSARYLDDSGVTTCWQSPWTSVQVPRANRRVCVPCLRHETISARVLTELNRINDIKTKRFAGTGCLNGEGLLPWMVYSLESIHSGDCWLHNVSCMCRLYWLTRKNNNSKNGDWNRRKSTRTSIVRQDQTDMHLKLLSSCHIPSIPTYHSLNRHLDPVLGCRRMGSEPGWPVDWYLSKFHSKCKITEVYSWYPHL